MPRPEPEGRPDPPAADDGQASWDPQTPAVAESIQARLDSTEQRVDEQAGWLPPTESASETRPATPDPVKPKPAPEATPARKSLLNISDGASLSLIAPERRAIPLLSKVEEVGRQKQACGAQTFMDEREVVLGMDLGTSCVKAVIGDSALGRSFAVRFRDGAGIDGFLLPSRLLQTGTTFSLEGGTHDHRDLKLALMADPDDSVLQVRFVAFMALAIRRARGWLLTEHASTYKQTRILWRLCVGLPAAHHFETPLSEMYERLARAAWGVADAPSDVTESLVQQALSESPDTTAPSEAAEVSVIPEIAAQIYGFVMSNSFDSKADNIYLMADIGAGTLDSALFRVRQGRGGRWDFAFYTCVVEPNGVSNLHRHRVRWWTQELEQSNAPMHLVQELSETRMATDVQYMEPESFESYFTGIEAQLTHVTQDPDWTFYEDRVLPQVRGKTFWRTWKDNLLTKERLDGIPFFACGGGFRLQYYQRLEKGLAKMAGYSWLKAKRRSMGVPKDLNAQGLGPLDYDRLSVAYGLSRLEVGKVVKALPMPKLEIPAVDTWRENYVDKDVC